jgi:hypothetical protein
MGERQKMGETMYDAPFYEFGVQTIKKIAQLTGAE